jgi:hypothetical protein
MAQITTASLMQAFQNLEERVKKIEERLQVNDKAIERIDERLKNIETMFKSIEKFAIWGVVSPALAGVAVVLLQHWFHF